MAGTRPGGIKAAASNKEKFGADFYVRIAHKAQEAWRNNGRKPRGFAYGNTAAEYGRIGGSVSTRSPRKPTPDEKKAIIARVREEIKLDRGDYMNEIERDNRERMARLAARFK